MAMAPYKSGGGAQHRGGMLLTVPHVIVPAMLVAGPRMLRAMKLNGPSKKKKAASSKTGKSAPSKSKKKKSAKSKK